MPTGEAADIYLGGWAATVLLAAALQLWARRRLIASTRALERRAREKEVILRDLHDGIGSAMTNIRLLAEIGKRSDEKARKAVVTIASLSGEAIAELRAILQTVSESEATWQVLAAELHRYGGQLLDAHGIGFEMTAAVDDRAPPSGMVCLSLLRFYREALTNVVKHSAASRVQVDFAVSPRTVKLSIADDGAGAAIASAEPGTGFGIANMRARAVELGGTSELERSRGTRASIDVPLPGQSPIAEAKR